MIALLAGRELRALFGSSLAWGVLAVLQFILAWMFLAQLDAYLAVQPEINRLPDPPGATELVVAPLFANLAVVLLMAIPLFTMGTIAGERRARTLPLLISAPLSLWQIVLGKYLGLMAFLALVCLLPLAMALSLALTGPLDFGLVFANLLGLLLVTAALSALGLWISACTPSPVLAAFLSLGAALFLWVFHGVAADPESGLAPLSLFGHFEPLNQGLLRVADVGYFGLFIIAFLLLTVRRLDAERLGG